MHVNCFCSNEKLRLGPKLPNFRQLFKFEPCSQVHTYHLAASARMCEWSLTGLIKAIFYANVWNVLWNSTKHAVQESSTYFCWSATAIKVL